MTAVNAFAYVCSTTSFTNGAWAPVVTDNDQAVIDEMNAWLEDNGIEFDFSQKDAEIKPQTQSNLGPPKVAVFAFRIPNDTEAVAFWLRWSDTVTPLTTTPPK